jgi:GNAT superfamily N-acetyltransferase
MSTFTYKPVTPDIWRDFTKLFGKNGACGGCWCMYWRCERAVFERRKGEKNRRAMKRLIDSATVPGIIGYIDGKPAAWCSVAPRDSYPGLARSRILKPLDDKPVWSVTCLFVAKDRRRLGLSVRMLKAAAEYARCHGARIIEGYPFEPEQDRMPDPFVWLGLSSAYKRAGFKEVARRSPTRPIMRRNLRPGKR